MDKEYQNYLSGEYFQRGSKSALNIIVNNKRLLAKFNATDMADTQGREALMREMFGAVGKNVHIDMDFHSEFGKHVFLGDDVVVNMNCIFLDDNYIRIGNNVLIAPNVQLYTATHPVSPKERFVEGWDADEGEFFFRTKALPITIEDNVWIGGGTIVLPGVTIGHDCVIGAGSVVTKSVPPGMLALGNPCRVIRPV